eukprot:2482266-Prymnesium_polylepis.1
MKINLCAVAVDIPQGMGSTTTVTRAGPPRLTRLTTPYLGPIFGGRVGSPFWHVEALKLGGCAT